MYDRPSILLCSFVGGTQRDAYAPTAGIVLSIVPADDSAARAAPPVVVKTARTRRHEDMAILENQRDELHGRSQRSANSTKWPSNATMQTAAAM
jgi:hypothetical protein